MGTARYYSPGFESDSGSSHADAPGGIRGWPYLIAGVAIISGFTVFISLCERDNSRLLAVDHTARTVAVRAAAAPSSPLPATSLPASDEVTRVTVPTRITPAPAPPTPAISTAETVGNRQIQFTLARSRRLQHVGPVSVVLWKVDTRRKLYDLSLLANGHRVYRKNVSLNAPVSVAGSDPSQPFSFIATSMSRNALTGYLNAPSATR
jgi:hypothetical protein